MTRTRLALVATALLATVAAADGLGVLEGAVLGPDGQPLAGVRVTVRCGAVSRAATTDGGGSFRVADLPPGSCTVESHRGDLTASLAVAIAADSIASALVSLAPPPPPPPAWDEMPMPAVATPAAAMPEAAPPRLAAERGAGAAAPMPPPLPMREVQVDPDGPARRVGPRPVLMADPDRDAPPDPSGWAVVRVFPVPRYTGHETGPRTDFRETIYWNPTVETDARGDATVRFVTSDAITGFAITAAGFAAGGALAAGHAELTTHRPLSLDVHLPTEVSAGDTVALPITLANQGDRAVDAVLGARFGGSLTLTAPLPATVHLAPGEQRTVTAALAVGAAGDGEVALTADAGGLRDELTRAVRVVPRGFPQTASAGGTLRPGQPARHRFALGDARDGSLHATVTVYTSPVAAMTKGLEGMLREPGGCFEQTSATNYPNTMVLSYLAAHDDADPATVRRAQDLLDHGYHMLTGFETKDRGYEWFGHAPAHEALTAYGLMEFADMARVRDVDAGMVERTAAWLASRRDGKGGFARSDQALDSFGRASPEVTDAYIVWALAGAGRAGDLGPERELLRRRATASRDPYFLALAAGAELRAGGPAGPELAAKLARLQAADGGFPGARETITVSGGTSREIETTALATLALIDASPAGQHEDALRAAAGWLDAHRSGYGEWGNTQATVLSLKALTAYAEHTRGMAGAGTATLLVDGVAVGSIAFERGRKEPLVWEVGADRLRPGARSFELRFDGEGALPYTVGVDYRVDQPPSAVDAPVTLTTALDRTAVGTGDGLTLTAHVENRGDAGVPMTLARIGIPGGTVFQTWQLQELRDHGVVDFYETRPREVILYWSALAPHAQKDVTLRLLAAVPGRYQAPASAAYLYYTAEQRTWAPPLDVEIAP